MLDNPWLGLALWVASYIADYYLTLYSARLYRQGAQEHFLFEGSLELTPYYQADIDALRRVSLRFVAALLLSALLMEVVWYLANVVAGLPLLFEVLVGGLVLREAANILRHVRNLALFRALRAGAAVTGQVYYPRRLSLWLSAAELLGFAALFGALALLLGSWFLAGGALGCAVAGVQHWRRSGRKQEAESRRQKAEGRRQKAVGRRQKAVGGRRDAEGGRQKAEGRARADNRWRDLKAPGKSFRATRPATGKASRRPRCAFFLPLPFFLPPSL